MTETNTKMVGSQSAIKHVQDDLAHTFAAFKSANDQRLTEIESKQSADVLLNEKIERINSAMDMQEKQLARLASAMSRPELGINTGPSETKSAWDSYIRRGDAGPLNALEEKSLSASVDAEGGYVVPSETENTIDTALRQSSPFRQISTVRQVGALSFKKPVSAGGAASGWAGETDARPETTAPTLELLEFPVGELYAMPAATQTLLDDGVADVDQWLADEVRDIFAAQETAAFVNGDGINKPKGFLDYTLQDNSSHTWGNIGYLATGTDGDFDSSAPIDDLISLIYAPEPRYRPGASFMMNRRTVGQIRRFKDMDGNYIWQPSGAAGEPSTLLGYPLIEVEDMPDISSDAHSIAFGDFRRGYMIVDRQGVRVLRDPYSAKPFVLFYTTKRVGGGVQDFSAIKTLKFGIS